MTVFSCFCLGVEWPLGLGKSLPRIQHLGMIQPLFTADMAVDQCRGKTCLGEMHILVPELVWGKTVLCNHYPFQEIHCRNHVIKDQTDPMFFISLLAVTVDSQLRVVTKRATFCTHRYLRGTPGLECTTGIILYLEQNTRIYMMNNVFSVILNSAWICMSISCRLIDFLACRAPTDRPCGMCLSACLKLRWTAEEST